MTMDDDSLDRLLAGDLDRLAPLPKRIVRIFISSTFTDMTLERNSLMERVYPRLKNFCREKYGLDFQDMRWGVRDEATDDHQTVDLCSRAINNCQRMSLGPNFVSLIGDKYGYRPLCSRIKSTEYRLLRRSLIEMDVNTDFLDTWFKEDSNAIPAEYLLQPISSILKNYNNKSEPELQSIDQRLWLAIQERLHELLIVGSGRLVEQGQLKKEDQLLKYSISVTEREVVEGCLDLTDAEVHCLVYIRSIRDLRANLKDCLDNLSKISIQHQVDTLSPETESSKIPEQERRDSQPRRASLKIGSDQISLTTTQTQNAAERKVERVRRLIGRYIDLIAEKNVWRIDEDAQIALKTLKESKLMSKFNKSGKNLIKFAIDWHEQDGISLKSDEHKQYLNELNEHFYTNITSMIRRATKTEYQFKSGLIGEVLQHAHYVNHLSGTFYGRNEELAKIRSYVIDDTCNRMLLPMFVYGVGGSGKTSVLAKSAALIKDWLQQTNDDLDSRTGSDLLWDKSPCVIVRFCGTTPSSSSIVRVLKSICRQLQFNFYQFGPLFREEINENDEQLPFQSIPDDFLRLVFTFRQLLDNCRHRFHIKRKFVIILDSLEHLSSPAESTVEAKYSWLTSITRLPSNVRLIVSCSSESTIQSSTLDYSYLKRHFIRAYYKFSNSLDDCSNDISTSRIKQCSNEAIEKSLIKVDSLDKNKDKAIKRFNSLKMLTTSVIRLMDGSRNYASHNGARSLTETSTGSALDDYNIGKVWLLHIKPLGPVLARRVLQRLLRESNRNLTPQQWSVVEHSFVCCSRPLFVKLAFGEVINWKSYSMQSDSKGLTFGSSILDNDNFINEQSQEPRILKLLEKYSSNNNNSSNDDEFRWQVVCMEQEWANYLELEEQHTRKEKEGKNKRDIVASTGTDSVVIRINVDKTSRLMGTTSGYSIYRLSSTIDDAICQLFARIEIKHGYILTKHCLSYLTAARNGICENELEDLLSLDDVVLDDVFQYHLPPVRRIPPSLWTRIRSDLPDYLSERDADGIVINWHHGRFIHVTRRLYLSDRQQLKYIHSMMADYFLGDWADKPKPFKCTKQQIQIAAEQLGSAMLRDSQTLGRGSGSGSGSRTSGRLSFGSPGASRSGGTSISAHNRLRGSNQTDQRFQWMQAKADRRVPHQPLFYTNNQDATTSSSDKDNSSENKTDSNNKNQRGLRMNRRYNLRKLTELPHHLIQSGRFVELATRVLFNYKWLYASLDALGVQNLLSDIDEASKGIDETISTLKAPINHETDPMMINLLDTDDRSHRIEEETNIYWLESLAKQLKTLNNTIRLSCSSIYGDTQMLAAQLIGRLLPVVRNRPMKSNPDNIKYIVQLLEQCDRDGCQDNALLPLDHYLQSPEGLQSGSLEGHSFAVMSMALTADRRHLLAVSNKFIMWDIATGEISRDIDPKIGGSIMRQIKLGQNNEFAIAYTSNNIILLLDILTQQVIQYHRLILNESSDLIGLDLVDKFGATSFIVWSKLELFALSVLDRNLFDNSSNNRITLELDYSIELKDFDYLKETSEIIKQIWAHQDKEDKKSHLLMIETSMNDNKQVQLVTIRAKKLSNSWRFELWKQIIVAKTLCLNESMTQLFWSDSRGNIYLSRRRRFRWSRVKIIRNRIKPDDSQLLCLKSISIGQDEKKRRQSKNEINKLLIDFENQIDDIQDELTTELEDIYCRGFEEVSSQKNLGDHGTDVTSGSKNFLVLYFDTYIKLLRLLSHQDVGYREITLQLPKDVRNISIEVNRCHLQALLVEHDKDNHTMALSFGKRLLFYSISQTEAKFIRSIEAHQARIVQLITLIQSASDSSELQCTIASASMDKTVKVWNLSNLSNDIQSPDKLDSSIRSMSYAKQANVVVCSSRDEVGIFDWRTLRLLSTIRASDLDQGSGSNNLNRIASCIISSNGRYLCFASLTSIYLYTLEGEMKIRSEDRVKSDLSLIGNQTFERDLPVVGLIEKMIFIQQNSRILLILVEDDLAQNFYQQILSNKSIGDQEMDLKQFVSSISVICFNIQDARLLYSIDISALDPREANLSSMKRSNEERSPKASKDSSRTLNGAYLLPVVTKDQAYIVAAEWDDRADCSILVSDNKGDLATGDKISDRKNKSASAMVLNVYSTRDGLLSHSIDLNQIEVYDMALNRRHSSTSSKSSSKIDLTSQKASSSNRYASAKRIFTSIRSNQFSRLKAVRYLERQSIVALIDDEGSFSFLIDVSTKQLLLESDCWNGKLSHDGRFGLSQMFKSTRLAKSKQLKSVASVDQTVRLSTMTKISGLHLLEMRHCSSIKTLLDNDTLSRITTSSSSSGSAAAGLRDSTGSGSSSSSSSSSKDIHCGFTKPNDNYVYYCDSRLRRLLLIRVHDCKLISNFKLPDSVVRLKCISDGLVILISLSDGSLLSLAIVDHENNESLKCLSQFPSRKLSRESANRLEPTNLGRRPAPPGEQQSM